MLFRIPMLLSTNKVSNMLGLGGSPLQFKYVQIF